jgi:hypothetical protein
MSANCAARASATHDDARILTAAASGPPHVPPTPPPAIINTHTFPYIVIIAVEESR